MKILSDVKVNNKRVVTVELDKNEEIEVKVKKRSKNANNLYWKKLSELCEVMNLNTIEEYKKRVKEVGIFQQFKIHHKNTPTFNKLWQDKGIAWFTEKIDVEGEFDILNAYYGSSSYNTKQMNRLIENLKEDLRQLNIPISELEEFICT